MCRTQCLLAFVALAINFADSWDIAISEGDKVEFYKNGTKLNGDDVEERSRDLTALAYDAVHNMLLFADKQDDNASIFSYNLATKMPLPLVGKKAIYEDIQGIAFDPVTRKLFWTDKSDRSIYWKSLKPGSKNEVKGNLFLKLDGEIPRAIAVDSCRGYVYWSNINIKKPTIERAKLDGTEWHTVIETDIYMPTSIAIDQRTKKLYWADDKEGIHFSIESADIDAFTKRKTLLKGIHHQPFAMALTKDDIYWVDWGFQSVWRLPKNSTGGTEPEQEFAFTGTPFGIVGNYPIEEQTENVKECENFLKIAQDKTTIDHDFNIPTDTGVYCLHGVRMEAKVGGVPTCKCTVGYEGERCEINVCQNFCMQGSCSVNAEGKPECSCESGFTGQRCEVKMCQGFCLNNGNCHIEDGRPMCACSQQFDGLRCEIKTEDSILPKNKESCNCTASPLSQESANEGEFVTSCEDGWDPIRDPVLMVLGTLSGLLCVACMVLITKVLQLKKRPRIRKRIIVNKNVTPLTARPDQCEITIENCCNMNICETPCFEPRSTIRPSLLDSKPGKEEKKNLIANMELPDDY